MRRNSKDLFIADFDEVWSFRQLHRREINFLLYIIDITTLIRETYHVNNSQNFLYV